MRLPKKEHDLVEYTLDLLLNLIDPNPLLPFSISHEFHNSLHSGATSGHLNEAHLDSCWFTGLMFSTRSDSIKSLIKLTRELSVLSVRVVTVFSVRPAPSCCPAAVWRATEKWPECDGGPVPPSGHWCEDWDLSIFHTPNLTRPANWAGCGPGKYICCYSNDSWEQHSYSVDTLHTHRSHSKY